MLLFDRDWPKAVVELRRIVADRKEPLRDEASLWLAHSLFQMGNAAEALHVIGALESDHPRSRWLLPAQSLRVEIAARTGRPDVLWSVAVPSVRVPQPPRTPVTLRSGSRQAGRLTTPVPMALTTLDVRIQALSGLMRREPDRAVPVLREIVVQAQETPQARRALLVLGLSTHEGARETVRRFAQSGPESLQVVAVGQLARWPSTNTRTLLAKTYGSGSARVKLAVLRSLGNAHGDEELIAIARSEDDRDLRGYAVAQLRQLNTPRALEYLKTLQ
jgi:hypothetical protein